MTVEFSTERTFSAGNLLINLHVHAFMSFAYYVTLEQSPALAYCKPHDRQMTDKSCCSSLVTTSTHFEGLKPPNGQTKSIGVIGVTNIVVLVGRPNPTATELLGWLIKVKRGYLLCQVYTQIVYSFVGLLHCLQ